MIAAYDGVETFRGNLEALCRVSVNISTIWPVPAGPSPPGSVSPGVVSAATAVGTAAEQEVGVT